MKYLKNRDLTAQQVLLGLVVSVLLFNSGCATAPKPHSLTEAPPTPSSSSLPFLPPPLGFYHTVEKGQTLLAVAKRYDINPALLIKVNNLQDPNRLETGDRLLIPYSAFAMPVRPPYQPAEWTSVEKIIGAVHPLSNWQYITVHHSATTVGNARLFDRDHRRRKMGGLFYHFVVGNGTSSRDGKIEVGWRWKKQVKANRPFDIQICLVGNFSKNKVSEAQMDSLVKLITILRQQYDIPLYHVRRHNDIKGQNTECPGRKFSFNELIARCRAAQGS